MCRQLLGRINPPAWDVRAVAQAAPISALGSARLPVNLIGSPTNRLIGSPITSQSTGADAYAGAGVEPGEQHGCGTGGASAAAEALALTSVFSIVTGEPFKPSAELTGEPIKMKA